MLQEEAIASITSTTTPANAQQFQQQQLQQQRSTEDWQEKLQRLEESNQALQNQGRELQAKVETFKVNSRIPGTNLNASQSKCNRLDYLFLKCYLNYSLIQLREVDGDRTALIHLMTYLMKRLPLGQEKRWSFPPIWPTVFKISPSKRKASVKDFKKITSRPQPPPKVQQAN